MSDFILHKGRKSAGGFARHYGSETQEVTFKSSHPTEVILADGRAGRGSCLGCSEAPCLEKHQGELALAGVLEAYPGDPNLDVCPTRAIGWKQDGSVAAILEGCIGCGLCITRCPYGAIHLSGGAVAQIETTDPDGLITRGPSEGNHSKPTKSGEIASLDASAAARLPTSVKKLDVARASLLVRNLLHEVGVNARVSRRGDTNMRIDAVGYSRDKRPFVAEIELKVETLESPRALLEDVAILHSRYGFAVADIDPLSIILTFPNARAEYYNVIGDIERVLGIRCVTITLGALMALLWHSVQLDSFRSDTFSFREGNFDLENGLGISHAPLCEPYPGAFRPAK